MSRLAVLLLAVLFSGVFCDHLGNFQGSYQFPDGTYMYLCQDGRQVQGTYSELGLIRGGANGAQLTGNFWSAGAGPCVLGTVELDYTDEGIEGVQVCNALPGAISLSAVRVSNFRPTNSQCGLISESDATLEGRWINNDNLELDLCFRTPDDDAGDDDDETVQGSLARRNSDGEQVNWFLSGFWVDQGRIALGTWYQDLSAGAFLLYLRDNQQLDYFFWTGLLYDEGRTFIDINQFNNPALHGKGTYQLPVGGPTAHVTSSRLCTRSEILQTLVLKNLPRDDDDNYYYFVQTEYLDNIEYLNLVTENSAALVFIPISLIISIIVALF